jgi:hypothetical protein
MSGLHNLSWNNLVAADRLGGLPAPSVAVVPEGQKFDQYGEITLIGKESIFDPAKEPVFDSDAYTGRSPREEYRAPKHEAIMKVLQPFAKAFADSGEKSDSDRIYQELERAKIDEAENKMLRSAGVKLAFLREQGEDVPTIMQPVPLRYDLSAAPTIRRFFEEHGKDHDARPGDEYWKKLTEAVGRAIDAGEGIARHGDDDEITPELAKMLWDVRRKQYLDEGDGHLFFAVAGRIMDDQAKIGQTRVDSYKMEDAINAKLGDREDAFQEWVHEKMTPFRTNPYVAVGRKKAPYNLENVTEAAVRGQQIAGAEKTLVFGAGNARATAAQRFSDINSARNATYQIKSPEEVKAITDGMKERASAWRDRMINYWPDAGGFGGSWEGFNAMNRALADYLKRRAVPAKQREFMQAAFRKAGFNRIPSDALDDSIQLAYEIRNAPVDYFEAKPQRAVQFDEFAGALIPKDAKPIVKQILEKRGIPFREYDSSNQNSRSEVLKAFRRELHEQGHPVLKEEKKPYGKKSSDFDKWFEGSKVVGDNGEPLRVFHGSGTSFERFAGRKSSAKVRPGLHGEGIWFTRNPDRASEHAEYSGGDAQVYPVYLSIKNPARVAQQELHLESVADLKSKGHDGAYDIQTGDWIAFDPEQIRSAFEESVDDKRRRLRREDYAKRKAVREKQTQRLYENEARAPELEKKLAEARLSYKYSISDLPDEQLREIAAEDDVAREILADRKKHIGLMQEEKKPYGSKSVTDSPAFKKWFGKSVMVDKDGKPKIVFHATTEDFDTFDRTHDIGFHFGTAAAANDRAAVSIDEGAPRIMPVYLKIERPLRLPDLHDWEPPDVIGALHQAGVLSDEQAAEANENAVLVDREQVQKWMDAAGYDGIVYANVSEGSGINQLREEEGRLARLLYDMRNGKNTPEHRALQAQYDAVEKRRRALKKEDSYIVFRPEQIKAAFANAGTFDAHEPSIVGETKKAYGPARKMEPSAEAAFNTAAEDIDFSGRAMLTAKLHKGTWVDKLNRWADALANGLGSLERLGEMVEDKLTPGKNPRDLLSYTKSSDHTVRRFFEEGTVDPVTREITGPSFKSLFEPFNGDVDRIKQAMTYVVSERIVGRGKKAVAGDEPVSTARS